MRCQNLGWVGALFFASVASGADPALDGNCPVCVSEMGKLIAGSKDIRASFDRQVFLFPEEKTRAMFQEAPTRYAPVLAGDCIVCLVEMGVRMPGKAQYALKHNERLYLFPSEKQLAMFKESPVQYARADYPLGEYCPVCLLEARKWIQGKSQFTSVYDGLRYQFPDAATKQKYDANPPRYVPALGGNCVVCLKDAGKQVRGQPQFTLLYADRLYLFPDMGAKDKFFQNPRPYADADLANAGNCVVCSKLAGKEVPGLSEHTSIYKGLRYLFRAPKNEKCSTQIRLDSQSPLPPRHAAPPTI